MEQLPLHTGYRSAVQLSEAIRPVMRGFERTVSRLLHNHQREDPGNDQQERQDAKQHPLTTPLASFPVIVGKFWLGRLAHESLPVRLVQLADCPYIGRAAGEQRIQKLAGSLACPAVGMGIAQFLQAAVAKHKLQDG